MRPRSRAGHTLLELLAALALLAVVAALAAPALVGAVHRARVRSALDLRTAALGCASAYLLVRHDSGERLDSVPLDPRRDVCLTSNVPAPIRIDSRGMLVGSPRTVRARAGATADSLAISIAGRVYRW
jgi:prepilin-type N-terminal cleavage/methylation domain-containing protein